VILFLIRLYDINPLLPLAPVVGLGIIIHFLISSQHRPPHSLLTPPLARQSELESAAPEVSQPCAPIAESGVPQQTLNEAPVPSVIEEGVSSMAQKVVDGSDSAEEKSDELSVSHNGLSSMRGEQSIATFLPGLSSVSDPRPSSAASGALDGFWEDDDVDSFERDEEEEEEERLSDSSSDGSSDSESDSDSDGESEDQSVVIVMREYRSEEELL
jgi:hypothetical protein